MHSTLVFLIPTTFLLIHHNNIVPPIISLWDTWDFGPHSHQPLAFNTTFLHAPAFNEPQVFTASLRRMHLGREHGNIQPSNSALASMKNSPRATSTLFVNCASRQRTRLPVVPSCLPLEEDPPVLEGMVVGSPQDSIASLLRNA